MTTDMSNESIADTNVELLKRISAGDEEAFRQLYDLTPKAPSRKWLPQWMR